MYQGYSSKNKANQAELLDYLHSVQAGNTQSYKQFQRSNDARDYSLAINEMNDNDSLTNQRGEELLDHIKNRRR